MSVQILVGDCRKVLKTLPDESIHCVVTSPPYWGLRDYGLPPLVWDGDPSCTHDWRDASYRPAGHADDGVASSGLEGGKTTQAQTQRGVVTQALCQRCRAWRGSLGLEPTMELYVTHLVEIFREVRRVLRDDGTLWLNMGDCYAGQRQRRNTGLKNKDLVGIPWRVALALQADGWWLRSDIVWHKLNCMPESVTDRPTRAHEYVFLLSKAEQYFYDGDAIREPIAESVLSDNRLYDPDYATGRPQRGYPGDPDRPDRGSGLLKPNPSGRNKRTVWEIPTFPFPEAHFATFPPALVEPMIKASTSERGCCRGCGNSWTRIVECQFVAQSDVSLERGIKGAPGQKPMDASSGWGGTPRGTTVTTTTGWQPGCNCNIDEPVPCTVLDPFAGACTTGLVVDRLGRDAIMIELKPEYAEMGRRRIEQDAPMFADIIDSPEFRGV